MNDTGMLADGGAPPELAVGYSLERGIAICHGRGGAGGLYSTVGDLFR